MGVGRCVRNEHEGEVVCSCMPTSTLPFTHSPHNHQQQQQKSNLKYIETEMEMEMGCVVFVFCVYFVVVVFCAFSLPPWGFFGG